MTSLEPDTALLGPGCKSLPPRAWGTTAVDFLDSRPELAEFTTPVLTLDESALAHNLVVLAEWTARAGVALAPHGKTTMAPRLWARQLDAGAWGITLATPWQVQVGRAAGVTRVLLANALVDPVGIAWVCREQDADPAFSVTCWADGLQTVRAMTGPLDMAAPARPVDVVVELGADGGRTGARSVDAAVEVARAVHASPWLRVAGVGGYEGALAHDRSPAGLHAVGAYLDDVAALHRRLDDEGLYAAGRAIVTVGGSAYPDEVVAHCGHLADPDGARGTPTTVVLRSGAYVVHDDGFYASISPFAGTLRSAMHAWARVLSRPEPGLALLDAGKRDVSVDEGLPTAQLVVGVDPAQSHAWLDGSAISAVNDQHAFLHLVDDDPEALPVGSVVRLGLSHPCTALDKWRLIPVVADAGAQRPQVIDLVTTWF